MPEPKRYENLELSESDRAILRTVVDGSLAAQELAGRAKKPIQALTQREKEVLKKASSILSGSGDVSSLKLNAGQLTMLEGVLRKSSTTLEEHSDIIQKTGRITKAAAQKVSSPLVSALGRQVPDVEKNPSTASQLAREMKGLYGKLKRFRENLEIQIDFGGPKGGSSKKK